MHRPFIKDFSEEVLYALESQKRDEKFSQYAKSILLERYLDQSVPLTTLIKKIKTTNTFKTDVLWDAISMKLMTSPLVEMKQATVIIDHMPIDYLVRISQHAMQEPLKQYASVVCYEKQLELEKELGLDEIDYEKFAQDELVVNETPVMVKAKFTGRKKSMKQIKQSI